MMAIDNRASVWEVDTGKERRLFQGHELPVHSVALSPDERYAASASGSIWEHQDNSVRVWNVATGKELRKFTAHQNVVVSVGFSPDGKVLASASEDGTTLIWDMSALGSARQTPMKILSASELESLWKELASDDAAKAYEAIQTLTAAPAQAETFLRTRLQPAAAENPKQVRQWIADLDSDHFAVRTKAAQELENLGEQVESALRIVLAGKASPESRRQIESLLKRLDQSPSGNKLRELRAVEILEHLGTIESQRLLRTLAGGAVAARLSQEAKASLNRLD
ncbi:MAG TPA: hypothetical protein VGY66_15785 [Gemmataceae bacterium]|nr:hypothetical protein [Gemmataceae bacterium]